MHMYGIMQQGGKFPMNLLSEFPNSVKILKINQKIRNVMGNQAIQFESTNVKEDNV